MRLSSLSAYLGLLILVLGLLVTATSQPIGQIVDVTRLDQLQARSGRGTSGAKRPSSAPPAPPPSKKPKTGSSQPGTQAQSNPNSPKVPLKPSPAAPLPVQQAPLPAPGPPQAGGSSKPSLPSGPPLQGSSSSSASTQPLGNPQKQPQLAQAPNGAPGAPGQQPVAPGRPGVALPFAHNGVTMPVNTKGVPAYSYTQAEIDREAQRAVDHFNQGTQEGRKSGQNIPGPGRKFPHEMPNVEHPESGMAEPFPAPGAQPPTQASSAELKGQIMSWPMQPGKAGKPSQPWSGSLNNTPPDRLILTKPEDCEDWTSVTCIRHESKTGKPGGFAQGDRYRRALRAMRRALATLKSRRSLSLGLP